MSKFVTYVHQQLAACGFAVLSGTIAATLRPDMFATGIDASSELGEANRRNAFTSLPRVMRMVVKLDGLALPLVVLTRSLDDLERRIEQVTGFKVLSLEPEEKASPKMQPAPAPTRPDHLPERLAKLRALAAQELPTYECSARTEIIKARQELDRMGAADGVGFVPV